MIIYLICFSITIFLFYLYEKSDWNNKGENTISRSIYCVLGFIIIFTPLTLLYGLRVDVGTDYSNYARIYDETRSYPLLDYIQGYDKTKWKIEEIEFGYYLINRIAYLTHDNVHFMFFLTGVILFSVVFAAIRKYSNISYPYAIFIFLMTQYAPANNTVRFALACVVILYGFKFLIENNLIQYMFCVLVASLFHRSAICGLVFLLLKDFNSDRVNRIRDRLLYIVVIASPIVTKLGMMIAMKISFFEKYSERYQNQLDMSGMGSVLFLWRCLPAIVAIRLLVKLHKIDLGKYKVLLNIQLCRIPLLYLGNYITFASRMDRMAWMSEIILIPYVINKITDARERKLAYLGFALWYIFIFVICYVIQRNGEIFPYKSIITT